MRIVETAERLARWLGAELQDFHRTALEAFESGENVLVIAPTGTGKTKILAGTLILHYGRATILAPTRALTREIYKFAREIAPDKRVVLANKDVSVTCREFREADIRVTTPYKLWHYVPDCLDPDDGPVVIDEVHELPRDPSGEAIGAELVEAGYHIMALSATVSDEDAAAVARWLDATIVKGGERPVPLKYIEVKTRRVHGTWYVVDDGGLGLPPLAAKRFARLIALVAVELARSGAGVLVWTPVRRNAEEIARNAVELLAGKRLAASGDRLAEEALEHGVGIHHGGIAPSILRRVEELFAERRLRLVVTCYTLSMGVNLPARYVVFAGLRDYKGGLLDASTFHQIAGRAGRPQYDRVGYVVAVTRDDEETLHFQELIATPASRIEPSLENKEVVVKAVARLLSLRRRLSEVKRILSRTYTAAKYGDLGVRHIMDHVDYAVGVLEAAEMARVEGDTVWFPTLSEYVAARLGLHPVEYEAVLAAEEGVYKAAVEKALEAAKTILDVRDSDHDEAILRMGLLAVYTARSSVVRDLADYIQIVLDAAAVHAGRVYGWRSPQAANARRIARLFSYAGNERLERLASVLRHDEFKRIVRNAAELLFNPPDDFARAASELVALVALGKRSMTRKRVWRIVEAYAEYLGVEKSEAQRAYMEALSRLRREGVSVA